MPRNRPAAVSFDRWIEPKRVVHGSPLSMAWRRPSRLARLMTDCVSLSEILNGNGWISHEEYRRYRLISYHIGKRLLGPPEVPEARGYKNGDVRQQPAPAPGQ